jgi:hypothetical protein
MECAVILIFSVFALNLKFTADFLTVLEGSRIEVDVRERLGRRLRGLEFYWGMFIAILLLAAICFPVVRFSLGSFPFMWVFYLSGLICANFVTVGVSVFFKSQQPETGANSSKPKSKNAAVVMTNPTPTKEGENTV